MVRIASAGMNTKSKRNHTVHPSISSGFGMARLEELDEGAGTRAEDACLFVDDVEVALDSQAFKPYSAESADQAGAIGIAASSFGCCRKKPSGSRYVPPRPTQGRLRHSSARTPRAIADSPGRKAHVSTGPLRADAERL